VGVRELHSKRVNEHRPRSIAEWAYWATGFGLALFGGLSLGNRDYPGWYVAGPICLVCGILVFVSFRRLTALTKGGRNGH
jgi:hypothetical protein